MSESEPRRGILAGGNFIVDTVKVIDKWPQQDTLCSILSRSRSSGGGPYNILKNMALLAPDLPREACGLLGNDDEGNWILQDCHNAGIDTRYSSVAKAERVGDLRYRRHDRGGNRQTHFFS